MTRKMKNGQSSIKDVKEQHKEDEEAERWQAIWGHCKQWHTENYLWQNLPHDNSRRGKAGTQRWNQTGDEKLGAES